MKVAFILGTALWVKDRSDPRQVVDDWKTLVGTPVDRYPCKPFPALPPIKRA